MSEKKAVTVFSPWKQERNRKPSENEVAGSWLESVPYRGVLTSLFAIDVNRQKSIQYVFIFRAYFKRVFQSHWPSKDKTEKMKRKLNITEIV